MDEIGNFLSDVEIKDISDKVFKLLIDSDVRKTESEKLKETEDLERE